MRPAAYVGACVTLGADPEIFLRDKSGRLIASEEVITGKEIAADPLADKRAGYSAGIARDGIQVEFHPQARTCRQEVSLALSAAMQTLERLAAEKGARMDFTSVIEVSEEDFAVIPPHAKELGCGRSFNVWDPTASVGVDGQTYRIRSAAGHVHLGLQNMQSMAFDPESPNGRHEHIPQLVKLLDLIVGNTCVLIDRDPLAAKRRETYGRAGEYRTTSYGMEYRTLSNFWLRGPQLASMVWGLSRTAVALWAYAHPRWRLVLDGNKYKRMPMPGDLLDLGEIFSRVDPGKVIEAINTNNFQLARENYNAIRGWFTDYQAEMGRRDLHVTNALTAESQAGLEQLITGGLDRHFPATDPAAVVERWRNFPAGGYLPGWESWCEYTRLGQLTPHEENMEHSWTEWRKHDEASRGGVRW